MHYFKSFGGENVSFYRDSTYIKCLNKAIKESLWCIFQNFWQCTLDEGVATQNSRTQIGQALSSKEIIFSKFTFSTHKLVDKSSMNIDHKFHLLCEYPGIYHFDHG